jgi:hypothetical protein
MLSAATAAFLLALTIFGCEVAPEAGPTGPPEAVTSSVASPPFRLSLQADRSVYQAGEPVDVRARLDFDGPNPSIDVWGSGSGPLMFSLEQLDGPFDVMGAATADCRPQTIDRGGLEVPFRKSGGWSGDDPNAAAFEAFMKDPVLRLPSGTYRLSVSLSVYLAECAMEAPAASATTTVTVVVEPAP